MQFRRTQVLNDLREHGKVTEEQGAKANEAAQKIGSAIQAAVLPVNVTLGYLGIQAMMPGKTLEMLPQAALIILLAIGLLVAAIRVLQRQRPFQAFWFYGGAALIAFLGISVVLLQLEAFPLSATLQKYSDVLALYGSSILTLYGNTLRIFSLGLFLAGVLMLVIFFSCRHQRIHSIHHELSTFF